MAEHIKTIIKEYIEKNKQKTNLIHNVQQVLEKKLNKEVVKQTQPEITQKEEVTFFTKSSSAAYQIRLNKEKIKKEIDKENLPIKKIKIEVR